MVICSVLLTGNERVPMKRVAIVCLVLFLVLQFALVILGLWDHDPRCGCRPVRPIEHYVFFVSLGFLLVSAILSFVAWLKSRGKKQG